MITSIVFIVFGLIIRVYAIVSLGRDATWRILAPKRVVDSGIYKFIRHPMYLGSLLSYTGLALLMTNIGTAFVFFMLLVNFTFDRIDREEQLLARVWGDDYINYMKRTKMLIPFII